MHHFIKRKYIACFECLKRVDEEGAAGEHSSPKRCAESKNPAKIRWTRGASQTRDGEGTSARHLI
jgi:hypothetical protein